MQHAGDVTMEKSNLGSFVRIGFSHSANRLLNLVGLWLCLILPSAPIVEKFFGFWGLGIYCGGAALGVWAASWYELRIGERKAFCLLITTLASLALLFAITYPIANEHIAGWGSDDDDALN